MHVLLKFWNSVEFGICVQRQLFLWWLCYNLDIVITKNLDMIQVRREMNLKYNQISFIKLYVRGEGVVKLMVLK